MGAISEAVAYRFADQKPPGWDRLGADARRHVDRVCVNHAHALATARGLDVLADFGDWDGLTVAMEALAADVLAHRARLASVVIRGNSA